MENECEVENKKYHFKGNFVKAEIFELVETHKISIKEAWCLLVIDNLQLYGQDISISNKALGERLQIKEDMVGKIISKLKGMGILVQTRFDGRKRWLNIDWDVVKQILSKQKGVKK